MLIPPALQKGDAVRVIAPSGPVNRCLALRGIAALSQYFKVSWDWGLFEHEGFLAGSDSRRLRELNEALTEPCTRAIIAVRGGYGAARLTPLASWSAFVKQPKWLIGFSDITALHLELHRWGVASLHAPNLSSLGRYDQAGRKAWLRSVMNPTATTTFENLQVLSPGEAEGVLLAANLTVLGADMASGRGPLRQGTILALEDVGEAPYRLDRTLTSLVAAGHLNQVKGVILGEFLDCQSRHHITVAQVVTERLAALRIPILARLPFGHGKHNASLTCGLRVRLSSRRKSMTFRAYKSAP